ncbi:protein FAM170A isoform X1 [Phodopus roborovskii]|uniref:Fam170a protein n=2 Tax=Phodopus roborovskii TaxID=109678 RepID=A0AAU9ZY31_PHORO|nr:protein FAM170A isoform X1 [Phodopus roborovskii]CAH7018488.1 Fam170a [Phodopus roborovskii]
MKRRQKRKHLEIEESEEADEKSGGISKSQEDVPQPESTGVAKAQSPGVGEVSSASEYFSCVSSPHKLIHRSKGTRQSQQDSSKSTLPLDQVPEGDATNITSKRPFSSCPSYKTCVSSLCTDKEDKGMKIYYMQVQMKKGVAVSWDTKETSESPEKQPRMEEATLPEGVWVGTPPSDVSTRNPLSDSEPSGEEKEHEEKPESDSPPGSPMIEERPRAKTPDWLVTMENGFRCMACCRGFATIESLQEHVQYGIREGFSCHVFHLTMAQLIGNVTPESTQKEEENNNKEKEKHKAKKAEEQQPTEENGTKQPWSQCPGCMFDSPKDRRRRKDHQGGSGRRQNGNSIKEDEKTNTQSDT